MAISLFNEDLVLISQAHKLLPGRPHRSTLERWRLKGRHGVRLESLLIGGLRYTSKQALTRFCNAVTAAADGEQGIVHQEQHNDRQSAVDRAEQYLAANGVR